MEKLLSVRDIMERYGCSRETARVYMRKMEHMEKPLRVRESVLRIWELERTRAAGETAGKAERGRKKNVVPLRAGALQPEDGKHLISRKRPTDTSAWDRIMKSL